MGATMPERDFLHLLPASLEATGLESLQSDMKRSNPAMWMHERLKQQIAEFETSLNAEEEVGGRLVSAAGEPPFHIEEVSYWGPDMLMFKGRNTEGRPVLLVQHYTQLSVLLTAMRKQHDKPRRIGFMPLEEREKKPPR
jgi:hypothetical protein